MAQDAAAAAAPPLDRTKWRRNFKRKEKKSSPTSRVGYISIHDARAKKESRPKVAMNIQSKLVQSVAYYQSIERKSLNGKISRKNFARPTGGVVSGRARHEKLVFSFEKLQSRSCSAAAALWLILTRFRSSLHTRARGFSRITLLLT